MIPRHLLIAAAVMLVLATSMSFYAWHMRRQVGGSAVNSTAPVGPPISGQTEQVALYVAVDSSGRLRAQAARIPLPSDRQERAQELLHALIQRYLDDTSPHQLGPGSDVRTVYLVDPGLAVVDLNLAFADSHRSGVLVEELTVASLVQTLSANIPGLTRVKILVDGKERETLAGHIDLTNFFDAASISQLTDQLAK